MRCIAVVISVSTFAVLDLVVNVSGLVMSMVRLIFTLMSALVVVA